VPRRRQSSLEQPDRNRQAIARAYPVRYDITDASSSDVANLSDCLQGEAFVNGFHETNDDA
jgi:hypothetical protein